MPPASLPRVIVPALLAFASVAVPLLAQSTAVAAPATDSLGTGVRVAPAPRAGFSSPYHYYVPPRLLLDSARGRPRTIVVLPNNTGLVHDDPMVHDEYIRGIMPYYRRVASRLGVIVMMPAFPRPASHDRVYTHALDRDVFVTREVALRRPDLQLLAMIDDLRARLGREGIDAEPRVLMHGHSAAGMFVTRFLLLHPSRVKAASVGSPGGWPTVPIRRWRGVRLRFPVGVGDLETVAGVAFDSAAVRALPIRFFIGANDENDAVPFADAYDPPERAQVERFFGRTPVARWPRAEAIWRRHAPRSEWHVYPGVGHEVTRAMLDDIWHFLGRHAAH